MLDSGLLRVSSREAPALSVGRSLDMRFGRAVAAQQCCAGLLGSGLTVPKEPFSRPSKAESIAV